MKTCIICRETKENFNDEHVIPEAIQGYYHINSVCTECNSKLGAAIDNKLTNHKFVEFQRNLLGIKGKSKSVPNPFRGVHTAKGDDTKRLILEFDGSGSLIPRLLPEIPDITSETLSFSIKIDRKDENKIDEIINKIADRNGIPRKNITIKSKERETISWIKTTLEIDIHDFKIALLKIAYEFAVDKIPEYFDDEQAAVISNVLFKADFINLTKKVKFLGNGFDRDVLQAFDHLIELDGNNHYLILVDSPFGLVCFINLFNSFFSGIMLSDRADYLGHPIYGSQLIVGKNDLSNHSFKTYDIEELMLQLYSKPELRFMYHFPDDNAAQEYLNMEKNDAFGFYMEDDKMPLYDVNGSVMYKDIEEKLLISPRISLGDTINDITHQYILNERLFIRLLPSNQLYEIVSVRTEQVRLNKI